MFARFAPGGVAGSGFELASLGAGRARCASADRALSRFAKEGAKFHIGIAYATQSPTTINPDLLAQTENFFIGHLSSQQEVDCLCHLQVAFQGCENAIRFNRTPGLMQVLTQSHRYVVPMQANLYDGRTLLIE